MLHQGKWLKMISQCQGPQGSRRMISPCLQRCASWRRPRSCSGALSWRLRRSQSRTQRFRDFHHLDSVLPPFMSSDSDCFFFCFVMSCTDDNDCISPRFCSVWLLITQPWRWWDDRCHSPSYLWLSNFGILKNLTYVQGCNSVVFSRYSWLSVLQHCSGDKASRWFFFLGGSWFNYTFCNATACVVQTISRQRKASWGSCFWEQAKRTKIMSKWWKSSKLSD